MTAVGALSFEVNRGDMFGLIGPDGAGKTTTIRLICGLIAPDAGRITVLGRDPVRARRPIAQAVGYFSQRFTLYGDLSIDENVAFFAEIHGVSRYQEQRDRLLDLTQLTPFRSRLAERLSGGMKQKLALICTLVHEPDVLLLDEPTTGVDPVSRREFWKLVAEFRSRGMTILLATPYLDEAERCSRVALLHGGHLLALDEPAALRAGLGDRVVEVLAHPHRRAIEALRSEPGLGRVEPFGERLHVGLPRAATSGDVDRIRAVLEREHLSVVSVRPVAASLEDVFIDRLGAPAGASAEEEQ